MELRKLEPEHQRRATLLTQDRKVPRGYTKLGVSGPKTFVVIDIQAWYKEGGEKYRGWWIKWGVLPNGENPLWWGWNGHTWLQGNTRTHLRRGIDLWHGDN